MMCFSFLFFFLFVFWVLFCFWFVFFCVFGCVVVCLLLVFWVVVVGLLGVCGCALILRGQGVSIFLLGRVFVF